MEREVISSIRRGIAYSILCVAGVLFSSSALATNITVAAGPLSIPSGLVTVVVNGVGTVTGTGTLNVPDGTYSVSSESGGQIFGSFTILNGVVVSANGALQAISGGVGFDLTRLAPINLDPRPLTQPAGLQMAAVSGIGVASALSFTIYYPNGTYSVSSQSGVQIYGGFSVQNGVLSGTSGAMISSADGVAFNLTQLAQIHIDPTVLSVPSGLEYVAIGGVGVGYSAPFTVYFPNGTYTIFSQSGKQSFGSFQI